MIWIPTKMITNSTKAISPTTEIEVDSTETEVMTEDSKREMMILMNQTYLMMVQDSPNQKETLTIRPMTKMSLIYWMMVLLNQDISKIEMITEISTNLMETEISTEIRTEIRTEISIEIKINLIISENLTTTRETLIMKLTFLMNLTCWMIPLLLPSIKKNN